MSDIHYVSKKGKRKSNEDNHSIHLYLNADTDKPKVNFYAVYDGHGGKMVSSFLSSNLPGCFIHPKVSFPLEESYVNEIYNAIENILYTKYESEATDCGSTCLVVCHYQMEEKDDNNNVILIEYIDVINTGDSRLVGCDTKFRANAITRDHKPYNILERRRLMNLGARIGKEIWNDRGDWRINDLSVSRAFGDKSSKKYVICEPDLFNQKVTDTMRFIILACDGLWDVVTNQEAVDIVIEHCYDVDNKRIHKPITVCSKTGKKVELNIAETLASYAINEKESGDNVTIIVVFFD